MPPPWLPSMAVLISSVVKQPCFIGETVAIHEELGEIKKLFDSGALTAAEYEQAKARVLGASPAEKAKDDRPKDEKPKEKRPSILDPMENLRGLGRILVVAVILAGPVWLFLRHKVGGEEATRIVSAVARLPVTLQDRTVQVDAAAWTTVPLGVPYSGTVTVSVKVASGNPLNVELLQAAELPKFKAKQPYQVIKTFSAELTTVYKRSTVLPAGEYHLVLQDPSLGFFSSSVSDVNVFAEVR